MAKPFTKNIDRIAKDLEGNLERDLNILVRAIITDLSTKEIVLLILVFLLLVGQLVHKDLDQINQEKNLLRGVILNLREIVQKLQVQ